MNSPDDPRVESRAFPVRDVTLIAIVLASIAVAGWWAMREERPRLALRDPSDSSSVTGSYVGVKVCATCHPAEAAAYRLSGHASTLGDAATSALARHLDGRRFEDPELPGVVWTYLLRNGAFTARRTDSTAGASQDFRLDYVLGSGHHASTFVTLTDTEKPEAVEHRLTHYSADDAMNITPGQRKEQPIAGTSHTGRTLPPSDVLRCFGCHSTPVDEPLSTDPGRAPSMVVGPVTPNVSCERCHGPGRDHVRAANQGRRRPTMAWGEGRGGADSQLALCGQCHRHPARFPRESISPDNASLARFQPIGLSQSRCYTVSAGEMNCVTCHDPHSRASTDRSTYEAACNRCHDAARQRRTCPVSPETGCVDCHMPRVDSGQKLLFTDHWIRVRPSPPKSPR